MGIPDSGQAYYYAEVLTDVLHRITTLPVWAKALLLLAPTLVLIVVGLVLALRLAIASVLLWAFLIGAFLVGASIILWRVPKWQVKNLPEGKIPDRQKKFELENEVRKTIAQILGGALLAGLFLTAQQMYIAQDAQTVAREAQLDAQEAQITERFTRATEQLASDSLEIRVGGIYAFQRIARDSDQDFNAVSGILQTFVRENAPRNKAEEEYPTKTLYIDPNEQVVPGGPADIEAAVVSLVELSDNRDAPMSLYLPGTNLEGMPITEADTEGTYLFNANLQYASIIGGDLPNAEFFDSNLRGANLIGGKLKGTDFQSAQLNLSGANFQNAQLNHTEFRHVDLKGANFQDAQLYEADLGRVDLREANFQDANLNRAILCEADLRGHKTLPKTS